ncbi:MAG: hypothetical protein AAGC95_05225 [Pseudomonadota bacterium]
MRDIGVKEMGMMAKNAVLQMRADLLKVNKYDLYAPLVVGVLCAAIGGGLYANTNSAIFTAPDFWFNADIQRIIENITERGSDHYRTKVHPLFSLVFGTPFVVLKQLGVPVYTVVAAFVSVAAFVHGALFYSLVRMIGGSRLTALLAIFLLCATSAWIFWSGVPETYMFGGASILFCLLWVAMPRTPHDGVLGRVASVFSLSVTVTNWMAGVVAAFAVLRRAPALRITVDAFAIVAMLSVVQSFLYPRAGAFLNFQEETKYIMTSGLWERLSAFFFHGLVMPGFSETSIVWQGERIPILSVQSVPPAQSVLAAVCLVGWAVLVAGGLRYLTRLENGGFKIAFVVILAGQFGLHLLYGGETFLYAAHYAPLIVLLATMSMLGARRRLFMSVAVVTGALTAVHNVGVFREVIAIEVSSSARSEVQAAMAARPADPWPRGDDHFILAPPFSLAEQKSYLEPGGSMSPVVGGPGVSFWLADATGAIITTSDDAKLPNLQHRFGFEDGASLPVVDFQNDFYKARWRIVRRGVWELEVAVLQDGLDLSAVIRAVGPAAGPVVDIRREGAQCVITDLRWRACVPGGDVAYIGDEHDPDWMRDAEMTKDRVRDERGWAAARLSSPSGQPFKLVLEDMDAGARAPIASALPETVVNGLDRVDYMIKAQTAHLLMGLVNNETRPGDPVNYPLDWQRDGAYVVTALARAGRTDVALQLADRFAKTDFFGGFGAEGDAPGLSLWAIGELGHILSDPEFDQRVWPDVQRKADLLMAYLTNDRKAYADFDGPPVPHHAGDPMLRLVSYGVQDGLIYGRMDWHTPLLYINAVSWRGLLEAAYIAERLGHEEDMQQWRDAAADLKVAWRQELHDRRQRENSRTLMSGLWPTFIATEDIALFADALTQKTRLTRYDDKPLWTYFEVAKAHQWLYLDNAPYAWRMIDKIFTHSELSGLQVLWEGEGEENAFGGWGSVRGWVRPPHVSPHYWSAAELLSFALDALAYVELDAEDAPTLVIGAGVKDAWLKESIKASEVHTRIGVISWDWDGETLTVDRPAGEAKLRLGAAFPPSTQVIDLGAVSVAP